MEQRLAHLDGWSLVEGSSIEREFELADFAAGLRLIERVGALAEAANHHPDILPSRLEQGPLHALDALRRRSHRG